ncbi:hypothetical protein H0H92_001946 [Tricholoma furcatifolium]|nr:hypothetical protein H0H92_001946 [Tricholoma furcatifolium]
MASAAKSGVWLDAWAILDDMIAVGIQPDAALFNSLIVAQSACTSEFIWKTLEKMDELGVQPNAQTYLLVIRRLISSDNTEQAIQIYQTMRTQHIVPDVSAAASLIAHVASVGYPRLALDLVTDFEAISDRRLDHSVYLRCLSASVDALYLDGVVTCWKKLVYELNINPGEGICHAVLNTAARNGNPDLATDALRVLKLLGIEWQEYHFGPLIEAFSREGKLKEAIQVLEIMRGQRIEPVPETAAIFLEGLKDTESIDATWALMDELAKAGQHVDILVLQALITASVNLGDLQRAIGAYKSLADYGATADITIFNALFRGCITASHRELGNLLLDDMKALKLRPNQETYEAFIFLCLTQSDYEDAFFYLEEMKSAGFTPSYNIYSKIVKKCLGVKDTRYEIAMHEMREKGYKPKADIRRLILRFQSGKDATEGADPTEEDLADIPPQPVDLDGAALRFIETGGVEGAAQLPKDNI